VKEFEKTKPIETAEYKTQKSEDRRKKLKTKPIWDCPKLA